MTQNSQATRGFSLQEKLDYWSIPEPTSGCHLWLGSTNHGGYGQLWQPGGSKGAHRLAWICHKGPIPDGLDVLHRCDNPPCVNVDHLFLGTDADNSADKIAKGRDVILRGNKNGMAKLTPELVLAIRSDTRKSTIIGKEIGIDPSTVRYVKRRVIWKHI